MGERAAGAGRDIGIVLAVVGVLAVPHLLLGPSITADDWVWIRNGEFLGWWDAGGTRQIGRPGAYALYAFVFGLGGAHPLVHYLVQVALWAGAAVLVLLALLEVIEARRALVVTLIWLVAPSHTTLELWASTSQAWVAVGLLAIGARQVARAARGQAALWPGLVAVGLAGAFYEVAIVAAPVVALLVDRHVSGAWRWRTAAWAVIAVVPVTVWSLVSATVYSSETVTTEGYWLEHLAGPLAMGLAAGDRAVAVAVAGGACVAGALAWRRAPTASHGRALMVGGAAVVVAGTIPALRSYTLPFGMGDRLTAVSGLGAAAFWVGAVQSLRPTLSPPAVRAVIVVGLVIAVALRWDNLHQWDDVGDRGVGAAADLARRAVADPDGVVVHDGEIATSGEFYGIYDGWNATSAAQLVAADPTLVVQVDIDCIRSGPLPSDPLEQYGQRPEQRVPGCAGGSRDEPR